MHQDRLWSLTEADVLQLSLPTVSESSSWSVVYANAVLEKELSPTELVVKPPVPLPLASQANVWSAEHALAQTEPPWSLMAQVAYTAYQEHVTPTLKSELQEVAASDAQPIKDRRMASALLQLVG